MTEILERAANAGVSWPIEVNDKKLLQMLYPVKENESPPPEPDVEYIFHEMKKKNVTLMLLWEEYKEKHPNGLMYTQYCERYRQFKKSNKLSYHKEHKGGEEIEVDTGPEVLFHTLIEIQGKSKKLIFLHLSFLQAVIHSHMFIVIQSCLPG